MPNVGLHSSLSSSQLLLGTGDFCADHGSVTLQFLSGDEILPNEAALLSGGPFIADFTGHVSHGWVRCQTNLHPFAT